MKWKAYISNGKEPKEFELENTSPCDTSAATLHASRLFQVAERYILCLPVREEKKEEDKS